MSDQPKVSERMFNLVTDYGADCINHGINTNRPLVGYPLVTGIDHRAKEAALFSAIAELEQRAEKAEQERDLLMQEPNNRLDGYRELGAKCASLEEQVEKWAGLAVAVYTAWRDREGLPKLERAEALRALGQMRDEAVGPKKREG